MATPNDHEFDWDRAEAELWPNAEVGADADPGTSVGLANENERRRPVDSVEAQRPDVVSLDAFRTAQRRPIVPAWAKSKAEFVAASRWVVGYYSHIAGYHTVRAPKYGIKLAFRSPRGAARMIRAMGRWVSDAEGIPVRLAAVRREDADEYLRLSRQRDDRVRARSIILAASLLLGLGTALTLWIVAPAAARDAALVLAVAVLGAVGAPADRPLLDTVTSLRRRPKLTSEMVVKALSVLGIAGITQALAKDARAIGFPAPITREGDGWRADVELPPGVTVTEVADRREKLAAALGRPLGCVWPEGNTEVHPGRLVLFVADEDMSRAKQKPWPLLRSGVVDLFAPFAFGTDPRGRLVEVTLMFAAVVMGAIPRMGKTFALRLLVLAACLDPRAELHLYDLKGTGDLSALEPVAHRYRAGDDEEDIAYGLADLRDVQAEMRRRTKVIRDLPRDVCPENKVTPELASKRSLGLHPIVLAIDECQRWFEHPEHGKEIEAICEDLVRRGPATGIVTLFATQRPDSKSLPTGISSNAVLRFCLRVMGQVENDMVLGTSAYRNGVRATMFSFRDKGIGYLSGEGDDPQITRSFYVDAPKAEQVVARARAMREKAGTLSGHALGADTDLSAAGPAYNLLEDILAVVSAGEPKVWGETVAARLAELRPDAYGAWAGLPPAERATALSAALKPWRTAVPIRQVWGTDPDTGKGANRKGIHRDDIAAALAESSGPKKRN
jgi:DNA segregation ATPase FtsK/SpoIIIE, S-DNA-T family